MDPLSSLFSVTSAEPLLFATAVDLPNVTRQLVQQLAKLSGAKKRAVGLLTSTLATDAAAWLTASVTRHADIPFALECLAWGHSLPKIFGLIDEATWLSLFSTLSDIAEEAGAEDLSSNPVAEQFLAAELPMTLAWRFPQADEAKNWRKLAADSLVAGLEETLDEHGLPKARFLPSSRQLLACWTRSLAMARDDEQHTLLDQCVPKFEEFLRQNLLLTRPQGGQALSSSTLTASVDRVMLNAALSVTRSEEMQAEWKTVHSPPPRKKRKTDKQSPLATSAYSESSQAAVMRSDWSPKAWQFAATFAGQQTSTLTWELNSQRVSELSGDWRADVTIDGQSFSPTTSWQEVCWYSGKDGCYLELEQPLVDGWMIQRQIFFAREDRVLFIADAVSGEQPAAIEYRSGLGVANGVTWQPAEETREGHFVFNSTRNGSRVLPLAFPEWRAASSLGELQATISGMEMTLATHGRALYAPLFFDCDPARQNKECTWRQLSVGERLNNVPHDVAAGFRVQIGRQQWLIYRALTSRGNRTLLGHNLCSDFLFGRFLSDGTVEKLMVIEGEV